MNQLLKLRSVIDVDMLTVNRVAGFNLGRRNIVQGVRGNFERTRQRQQLPLRLTSAFIIRIMDGLDPYTSKLKSLNKVLQKTPKNFSALRNVFHSLAPPDLKM